MTKGYCHGNGMKLTVDPCSILISMPHYCRCSLFPLEPYFQPWRSS